MGFCEFSWGTIIPGHTGICAMRLDSGGLVFFTSAASLFPSHSSSYAQTAGLKPHLDNYAWRNLLKKSLIVLCSVMSLILARDFVHGNDPDRSKSGTSTHQSKCETLDSQLPIKKGSAIGRVCIMIKKTAIKQKEASSMHLRERTAATAEGGRHGCLYNTISHRPRSLSPSLSATSTTTLTAPPLTPQRLLACFAQCGRLLLLDTQALCPGRLRHWRDVG